MDRERTLSATEIVRVALGDASCGRRADLDAQTCR